MSFVYYITYKLRTGSGLTGFWWENIVEDDFQMAIRVKSGGKEKLKKKSTT